MGDSLRCIEQNCLIEMHGSTYVLVEKKNDFCNVVRCWQGSGANKASIRENIVSLELSFNPTFEQQF